MPGHQQQVVEFTSVSNLEKVVVGIDDIYLSHSLGVGKVYLKYQPIGWQVSYETFEFLRAQKMGIPEQ